MCMKDPTPPFFFFKKKEVYAISFNADSGFLHGPQKSNPGFGFRTAIF